MHMISCMYMQMVEDELIKNHMETIVEVLYAIYHMSEVFIAKTLLYQCT